MSRFYWPLLTLLGCAQAPPPSSGPPAGDGTVWATATVTIVDDAGSATTTHPPDARALVVRP
jgi:hypothetical protein